MKGEEDENKNFPCLCKIEFNFYQNYIDLNPCRPHVTGDCGVYLRRLYRSRSRSHTELRFVVSHAVAAARNARTNVITLLFHREWHIAAKGGCVTALPFRHPAWRRPSITVRVTRSYMNGIASPPYRDAILMCMKDRLFALLFVNQRYYVHYARIAWGKGQRDNG